MKKLIILLLSCIIFNIACKKSNPQIKQPINKSFPSRFHTINTTGNEFFVNGGCWTNISWYSNLYSDIYTQGNSIWIDSLNYVIQEPIPITIIDSYNITFKPYMLTQKSYSIVSGNGIIVNDTMNITVNCVIISTLTCGNSPNFTFKGKYKVLE